MKTPGCFAVVVVTAGMFAGCDGQPRSIPLASPIPTAPSPPAPRGSITLQSLSPVSGATLQVRECPYYPISLFATFWDMCSDDLTMTFEVEFETEVANAVVTIGFYSGSQRCGLATSQSGFLAARTRASFDAKIISFSDEDVRLLCPLPVETTRLVVQLWERGRPAVPLLTQEFAHNYKFAES